MLVLHHHIYLHKADPIRCSLSWPHSKKPVPEFNCIPRPFTKKYIIDWKKKFHPILGNEGPHGSRCIVLSTLSSNLELDMGGRFTPGNETRYPFYRRVCGPQCRSGRVRIILPSTGIRFPDRPARRKSLYRLRYLGPREDNKQTRKRIKERNVERRKKEIKERKRALKRARRS